MCLIYFKDKGIKGIKRNLSVFCGNMRNIYQYRSSAGEEIFLSDNK